MGVALGATPCSWGQKHMPLTMHHPREDGFGEVAGVYVGYGLRGEVSARITSRRTLKLSDRGLSLPEEEAVAHASRARGDPGFHGHDSSPRA